MPRLEDIAALPSCALWNTPAPAPQRNRFALFGAKDALAYALANMSKTTLTLASSADAVALLKATALPGRRTCDNRPPRPIQPHLVLGIGAPELTWCSGHQIALRQELAGYSDHRGKIQRMRTIQLVWPAELCGPDRRRAISARATLEAHPGASQLLMLLPPSTAAAWSQGPSGWPLSC
jgi:hypothetical protein